MGRIPPVFHGRRVTPAAVRLVAGLIKWPQLRADNGGVFRRPPSFLTTALTVLLCGACVHAAAAQDYPRLGLYGSVAGDGTPFLKGDGTLDTTAIAQVARYDEVILDVNPLTPYRPDIAAALRARNPGIRLLAYVLGHDIWPAADADSLHHYPTRYRRLVRDLDGSQRFAAVGHQQLFIRQLCDESLFIRGKLGERCAVRDRAPRFALIRQIK